MMLKWINYKIWRKRKLIFVLPWNMMLPFQKCRDFCGRMQYGNWCNNCHCCLGNCSINIFFVPSVQKNHFDVVFNFDVWTHYITGVFWKYLSYTRIYLFLPCCLVSCFQFACSNCNYYKCECISQRALSFRFYFTPLTQW